MQQTPASSAAWEQARAAAGLARLAITSDYQLVLPDEPDIVERTAAQELSRFLERAGTPLAALPESASSASRRLLLGRAASLRAAAALCERGVLAICAVSAEDDGYQLRQVGDDIVIAGANPRGVLYGVYAFEEFVNTGARGSLDILRVPWFRKRGSGPSYSFNAVNLDTEDFTEAKAAYLARLGINQFTDQGLGGHLDRFVHSSVFPFQTPPSPIFQRRVRALTALCKRYGIDTYLFLAAPNLPKTADGLAQYPPEALGWVKRPWGGGPDHLERTLCVSSPLVQEHLRGMMRALVREYPDLTGIQFYNMDGDDWLCTPALCPRCAAVCGASPAEAFNPWETQALLVNLLAGAAREVNPAFDFRLWGAVHYHGQHLERLLRAADGCTSLMSAWTGSDRAVMVPAAAKPDLGWELSRRVSEERGIPLYTACEFNNHDIVPQSLPYPRHVCSALRRLKGWGAHNLVEIFGSIPEHNPLNALAAQAMQWEPDQDADALLRDLAERQFGAAAGERMLAAFDEIGAAFAVWDDIASGPFPLGGSQFHTSMGIANGGLPPAVLPAILGYYDGMVSILSNVEPWLAEDYRRYQQPGYLEKMTAMCEHLEHAAEHARQAAALASEDEYVGICPYESPAGRPTCREYAELNQAPVAIAASLCRQRCNIMRACLLLRAMEADRASGNRQAADAAQARYLALVREDIGVQEQFRALLAGLLQRRPCYTRASIAESELNDLIKQVEDKLSKMREYLAGQTGGQ